MSEQMSLEELKKQNAEKEAAEAAKAAEADVEVDDDPGDDIDDDTEDDPEDDSEPGDDPDPDEQPEEDWQKTDYEKMSVKSHIKVKKELKGKIADRDSEIETLRAKIEAYEKKQAAPKSEPLVRPREEDYSDLNQYYQDLETYETKKAEQIIEARQKQAELTTNYQRQVEQLNKTVDQHYERAKKLVSDNGIEPEVYQQADQTVRESIEALMPQKGDLITDQMISFLGEGSEKVMYYIGRNKGALNELKVLLSEDPSGLKAAIFLGEQKARFTSLPAKRQSTAPKPASRPRGDASAESASERKLREKYDAAHKKNNIQLAYNIKQKAKKAGFNVKSWI